MKTPATEHLNASTERTLKLLSESLLNLLEQSPLEKITVIDICKNADVPRATFYNHFEDKFDLLRYTMHLIAAELHLFQETPEDEQVYIRQAIISLLDFEEKNRRFLKKVSSANYNSILFAEIKQFVCEQFVALLNSKKLQGRVYPVNEQIIAELYSNAIVYSIKTWLENDLPAPRDEIVESMLLLMSL